MKREIKINESTLNRIEVVGEIGNLKEFLQEHHDRLFGILHLIRHGDTDYGQQYPGMTKLGEEQVKSATRVIEDNVNLLQSIAPTTGHVQQDIFIVSSPALRARGSAKIIESELSAVFHENEHVRLQDISPTKHNFSDPGVVRVRRSLRPVDFKEGKEMEALGLFLELAGTKSHKPWPVRKTDRAYATKTEFERRDDLFEKRSHVKERILGGIREAARVLSRYWEKSDRSNFPRVVATSHFEVLNQIVNDVFPLRGIKKGDPHRLLDLGEVVSIYFLQNKDPRDKFHTAALLSFRGKVKEVRFPN